ncbi:MAG TPA: hypothetical protein VK644_07235 [Chitinophagaceae bacterium]|nr:hypothetical protein [Chitinophagaceae bacterium]
MNYLKLLGTCLSFCFCCASVSAQQKTALLNEPDHNRPRLFTNLPSRITVSAPELDKLLTDTTQEMGRDVNVKFSDTKLSAFSGKIVSAVTKYENTIHSVVIRSSNYPGATLSLSSSVQPDGTIEYSGRIISFTHGDCFELKKINNEYIFVKKDFYEVVNE